MSCETCRWCRLTRLLAYLVVSATSGYVGCALVGVAPAKSDEAVRLVAALTAWVAVVWSCAAGWVILREAAERLAAREAE